MIGTYQHFESQSEEGEAWRPGYAETTLNFNVAYQPGADNERAAQQEGGEDGEGGEAGEREGSERGEGGGEEVPPPLAPLSLAGLSLMGAAVLLAKQDPVKR